MLNKSLLGCCGLDCEACDARIATLNDDDVLREKTARLWTQLNGVEITAAMINCTGCRVEGAKSPFCEYICTIRKCALGKGCKTCADCGEMEQCSTLAAITANNPQALENLRS